MVNKKVSAIQCPGCCDILFSRATHDYRTCSCGESSIDGGFEYTKVSYKSTQPIIFSLSFKIGNQESLFNDWNNNVNKYGLIKTNLLVDKNHNYCLNKNSILIKTRKHPKL